MNQEKCRKIENNLFSYFDGLPENRKFSGQVLVSAGDEKIFLRAYGMADYELDVPNTLETKFRIGSITKQFTAASILQLAESGKIKFDDTLDNFIPDYPKGSKVTIHHLLSHSSGIFDFTDFEYFRERMMRKHYTVDELIGEFRNQPYAFEPGAGFAYINSGYVLLGYILEKISGYNYKEYIEKNILSKLAMKNSGYDDHFQIIKARASGYSVKNRDKTLQNSDFIDMSLGYSAGALYSTVEDLFLWNKALFGEKVFSGRSLNLMLGKHSDTAEEGFYGYGCFTHVKEISGKALYKVYVEGGIPGFYSISYVYPEKDIQIILLTNITGEFFGEDVESVEKIVLSLYS